jgi:multiple sugar transport system substrate-binding protein
MTRNSQKGIGRRQLFAGGVGATVSLLAGGTLLSGCAASSTKSVTTWYFPFGTNVESLYAKFKDQFEKENPKIKINLQLQPWDNRYPKMLTALSANKGPDVMFMTPDALIQFASAGVLAPLDDLIPASGWNGFDQSIVDSATYDGKRWYYPIDQEVPVWLYNKTLMKQIGLDPDSPPATWSDLRTVCEAAKKSGGDITGWGYNASSPTINDTFYPFLYQAGGRVLSDDLKHTVINSAEGVAALTFIVELFNNGWSPKFYLTPNANVLANPFFQKKQVVSIQYKQSGIANARQVEGLDWGLTPVLKDKEAWGFGATRSWAISAGAEDRDAAAAWVNFLARPENVRTHCEAFGITPANTAVGADTFKSDPVLASLRDRIPNTLGELKIAKGRQLMPLLTPEIQLAILGQKTPAQALESAAKAIDALLV